VRVVPTPNEAKNPFDIMLDSFREIVKEEIGELKKEIEHGKKAGPQKTDWLRAEELAAIYDLPKTWFEDRGREGTIMRTKPGRHMLFYRPDVDKYLIEHAEGGAKDKRN
jgi:hypothetical protein